MTRRQVVIDALSHKKTDLVPYHMDFTLQAHENMIKFTQDKDYYSKMGVYLNYIQYWGWPTELPDKKEHFKDTFGVVWNRSGADKDIRVVVENLVKDFENIEYVFPEIDEKRIRAEYEKLIENKDDRFTFGGIGFSVFERAWSLAGMEDVLIGMALYPQGVKKLFDMILEYNLKCLDIMLEYDLDGFYFGDDWGQQKGLIMGPTYWREFIKPVMKEMYSKVKEKGLFVLQHSCGDVETIFEDLIEIGLDCYQTFQPEIYDIGEMKKKYGDRLAFWGGISTQQLLSRETPDKVKEKTIDTIKIMSQSGGYIAAPTHAIEFDVPAENIMAMLEVFKNQEKYL